MSSQKTKFPKNTVPARKIHQATTIVGKNGLAVDALATIEPGSILVDNNNTTLTYSSPTITFDSSVDLSDLENFSIKNAEHTGVLLFTDSSNNSYFIDPNSINNTTKTVDIYTTNEFSSSPTSISLNSNWSTSEAELVNRLQTTTTAVVDNVEFRDVEVKVDLDGSTVNIKDDDGDQLEIDNDGSINTTIRDGVNPNNKVSVDSDQNLHVETHKNLPDGTDVASRSTGIVDSNSTNTPLLANTSFTGDWFDAREYSNLTVVAFSDQDSAEDGFVVQFSSDSVNIDDEDKYTIFDASGTGGMNRQFSFPIPSRYFRIKYTNGPINQSEFRLQTKVHTFRPKPSSHRVGEGISKENDAELVKSVLSGENPNGMFVNQRLDGKSDTLSSNIPLGAGGVFQSPVVNVDGFLTIDFTIISDQISATDGILLEWFSDEAGTQLIKQSSFSYLTAPEGAFFNLPIQGEFVRITYTNGATPQTSFFFDTRLRTTPNIGLLSPLESQLTGDLLAVLTRSVLFGRTENGDLNNVELSNSNSLKVAATDRPSEVRDRTRVSIPIPETTLVTAPGTVLYTVTPGRTLYITSFTITQLNDAAAVGSWRLLDDTVLKTAFILPSRVSGSSPSGASVSSPTMPEPLPFNTNVRVTELTGDVRIAGFMIGYEE